MPTTPILPPPPTTQGSNLSPTDYQWLLILQGLQPLYEVDTSKGSYTEAAPPAGVGTSGQTGQCKEITYIKTSSDGNTYTLTGVEGGNLTLTKQFSTFKIKSDGTRWYLDSAQGGGAGAVSSVFGRTGAVVAEAGDYDVAEVTGAAPLASPALTGVPTAPTAAALTDDTQIATTAYSDAAVAVEKTRAETAEALLAPLASPVFTGTPEAPTPSSGDNTTKIATTAFVEAAIPASLPPSGAAGGDLSGTYPNPTVAKVNGGAVPISKTLVGTNGSGELIDASAFAPPLTTLGDTMYENATPALARLPGNTSATKNFLTQTGTGVASAAPAWGTIAETDLPNVTDAGFSGFWGGLGLGPVNNSFTPPTSSTGFTANEAYVHLFFLARAITISKVTIDITTTAVGLCSVGIYSAAGTKLVDSGTFNTASGGVTTNFINGGSSGSPVFVTLEPGWYYQLWTTDTASNGFEYFSVSAVNIINILNKNGVRVGTAANTTSGAQPTSLGTVTAASAGALTDIIAAWYE